MIRVYFPLINLEVALKSGEHSYINGKELHGELKFM